MLFFSSNLTGFIEHRVPLPGMKICLVIYGNAHNYILLAYFKGPRDRSLVKVEPELTACVQIEPTLWYQVSRLACSQLSALFSSFGLVEPSHNGSN